MVSTRRLTPQQAAALVPTSLSLVYQWVKENRFPVYRIGGRGRRGKILIDEAEFIAFVESLKTEPAVASAPASPGSPGAPFSELDPNRLARAWRPS